MAVTAQDVFETLKTFAPPALACDWDNVGLLVDAGTPVQKILTTLDITPAVVEEAKAAGTTLVVSHHPVIFDPLKRIAAGDVPALLLQSGISAICMHTNLDAAPGGVNDTLADLLGLPREGRINIAEDCGRLATLPAPTTAKAIAEQCRKLLGTPCKYVEAARPVRRLAEVSGGGGSFLQEAIDAGADCMVTGEAAHHIGLLAQQKGIGLVVAGHWGTEHPVTAVLAEYLTAHLPADITVARAEADTDPYSYL